MKRGKGKLRAELQNSPILYDGDVEVGHLSDKGILILNHAGVYAFLLREAGARTSSIPVTIVYRKFGISGGWKPDPFVEGILNELEELKVIRITRDEGEMIGVWPIAAPTQALRRLPPYRTFKEIFAGLKEIEDE